MPASCWEDDASSEEEAFVGPTVAAAARLVVADGGTGRSTQAPEGGAGAGVEVEEAAFAGPTVAAAARLSAATAAYVPPSRRSHARAASEPPEGGLSHEGTYSHCLWEP